MIEQDRLFKELITTFFWEFLELRTFSPMSNHYDQKKVNINCHFLI
jgi:hypothetical protein